MKVVKLPDQEVTQYLNEIATKYDELVNETPSDKSMKLKNPIISIKVWA